MDLRLINLKISFNGPISLSSSYEVIIHHCNTSNGIILDLNINKDINHITKYFDCSFLSE